MEYPIGNIEGNFGQVDMICPRCDSTKVAIVADSRGYFYVVECSKCGYRNISIKINPYITEDQESFRIHQ